MQLVAPLVGAWIEILSYIKPQQALSVAPLVGAWIEITSLSAWIAASLSLPLWERGLKYVRSIFREWRMWSLPLWERGLK